MIFAFFYGFPLVERARAQHIIRRYVGFPVLSNILYWASCAHPARPAHYMCIFTQGMKLGHVTNTFLTLIFVNMT